MCERESQHGVRVCRGVRSRVEERQRIVSVSFTHKKTCGWCCSFHVPTFTFTFFVLAKSYHLFVRWRRMNRLLKNSPHLEKICRTWIVCKGGLHVTSFIYKYKTSTTYPLYGITQHFVLINKWHLLAQSARRAIRLMCNLGTSQKSEKWNRNWKVSFVIVQLRPLYSSKKSIVKFFYKISLNNWFLWPIL